MRQSEVTDGAMVILLSIDTTGPASSVALVEGEEVRAALYLRQASAFSRPLLRSIDQVFAWTGCTLDHLTGLVVNIGPGAFTGLRVGLATAQGLAMASGKPVVGCSAFEALVALVPAWQGMICPMLEARKDEVYAAMYCQQDRRLQEVIPGLVVTPEALCSLVTERTLFLGSGARVYGALLAAMLGDRAVCANTGVEEVGLAVSMARVGQARLRAAGSAVLPFPRPLYIRHADARLPRHAAATAGVSGQGATPDV
jgi:tRNA threonylcarbamoyladenosine biosynthesis protein TsaB